MLSIEQQQRFELQGFIKLPDVIDADEIHDMVERLWTILEGRDVDRNDPSTWSPAKSAKLHALRSQDTPPGSSPVLCAALDELFEGRWGKPKSWGQVLLTFPVPGAAAWQIPTSPWHVDHFYRQSDFISGINLFLLMDDLEPGGGGTCVLSHSPELIRRFMSSYDAGPETKQSIIARAFLASHPFFKLLKGKPQRADRNETLMAANDIDGINVRVVEFTGRAGDVYLCHPLLLHVAGAPNVRETPRMMRASRVYSSRLPWVPDG